MTGIAGFGIPRACSPAGGDLSGCSDLRSLDRIPDAPGHRFVERTPEGRGLRYLE